MNLTWRESVIVSECFPPKPILTQLTALQMFILPQKAFRPVEVFAYVFKTA